MRMIYVTPEPGMKIPNPDAGFSILPEKGEMVPHSPYWERRRDDGGVTISDGPPKAAPIRAAKAPAAKKDTDA